MQQIYRKTLIWKCYCFLKIKKPVKIRFATEHESQIVNIKEHSFQKALSKNFNFAIFISL